MLRDTGQPFTTESTAPTAYSDRAIGRASVPYLANPESSPAPMPPITKNPEDRPESYSLRQRLVRSRLGKAALSVATAAGLVATGLAMEDEPARADKVFEYTVTGTGGDGVWLHSDPGLGDNNDLIKVMPEGTRFKTECYVNDTPIGERNNPVWLYGTDETGATGYFTDYYSSSRWDRNNTLQQQGLPICGEEQPEQEPWSEPQSEPEDSKYDAVFYAPGDGETVFYGGRHVSMPVPDNVFVMAKEGDKHPRWTDSGGNCGARAADDFEHRVDSNITTLAGWSIGRLGPVYYLQNSSASQRDNIQNILLIDPGSLNELENNACDQRYDQSATYAKWLAEDENNRLTILAGGPTRDISSAKKPFAHQGIQQVLFGKIRGTKFASQVTVCNYSSLDHVRMYKDFRHLIGGLAIDDPEACPSNPDGSNVVGWRP